MRNPLSATKPGSFPIGVGKNTHTLVKPMGVGGWERLELSSEKWECLCIPDGVSNYLEGESLFGLGKQICVYYQGRPMTE